MQSLKCVFYVDVVSEVERGLAQIEINSKIIFFVILELLCFRDTSLSSERVKIDETATSPVESFFLVPQRVDGETGHQLMVSVGIFKRRD